MSTLRRSMWVVMAMMAASEARAADPEYLERIRENIALRTKDEQLLVKQGLVVLREGMPNAAHAYAFAYTQELPQMVTMESLFWAVAVGHEAMLEQLELRSVAPETRALLEAMHERWRHAKDGWAPEAQADVDLYLTVARSLDAGEIVEPLFPTNVAGAAEWLERVYAPERGLVTAELFGRERQIDLSTFAPRGPYEEEPDFELGHYADPKEVEKARWFRTAMWLTRIELNLVSRDCRSSHPTLAPDASETPREATVALALSRLAEETGVGERLATLSRALDVIVAPRVDVPAQMLARWIPKGPWSHDEVLRAVGVGAGRRFVRATPTHPMPHVDDLPVVWTLLGLRTTESTGALGRMLSPRVEGRAGLDGADVAFALGHERALRHLRRELIRFPDLGPAVEAARAMIAGELDEATLRGRWTGAILALAEKPTGVVPRFLTTEAYQDFALNSAVAAYARLRRNHVAYEAASFSWGGCDVPDGYVEPAPAALAKLGAYARLGIELGKVLDPEARVGVRQYYRRLGTIFGRLAAMVERQLTGAPLADEDKHFLHEIVEKHEDVYENSVAWNGWFTELFFEQGAIDDDHPPTPWSRLSRRDPSPTLGGIRSDVPEALSHPDVVVDVATVVDEDAGAVVSHLGTGGTQWAVFIVDVGGPRRAMVGPVSLAYAAAREFPERLTDDDARRLRPTDRRAAWTKSFAPWYERLPPVLRNIAGEEMGEEDFEGIADER